MEMIKTYDGTYYYNTHNNYTFLELYPDAAAFLADYKACEIPTTLDDTYLSLLYYVLVGRKGNDAIRSNSLGQFKYSLFTLIWQYGPYWQKQVEIQEKLRALSEEDLRDGDTVINNSGTNPAIAITRDSEGNKGTQSKSELNYINSQNVTLSTRSKTEAFTLFSSVLKSDVSTAFFAAFDDLFQFASTLGELLYCNEEDN